MPSGPFRVRPRTTIGPCPCRIVLGTDPSRDAICDHAVHLENKIVNDKRFLDAHELAHEVNLRHLVVPAEAGDSSEVPTLGHTGGLCSIVRQRICKWHEASAVVRYPAQGFTHCWFQYAHWDRDCPPRPWERKIIRIQRAADQQELAVQTCCW